MLLSYPALRRSAQARRVNPSGSLRSGTAPLNRSAPHYGGSAALRICRFPRRPCMSSASEYFRQVIDGQARHSKAGHGTCVLRLRTPATADSGERQHYHTYLALPTMTVYGKVARPYPIQTKENCRSYPNSPITIFGKAQKKPPVHQPSAASRSHEYLTALK